MTNPNTLAGHFRFRPVTGELSIVGLDGDVSILTLTKKPGGPLGIDETATKDSKNLVTSGAVFKALQNATESGGSFITDETLTLEDGVLRVNTADTVGDSTLPITAAAVNTTVGNIEILLKTI